MATSRKLAPQKFAKKSAANRTIIEQTIAAVGDLGIPTNQPLRRLEKMAMTFMAVAQVDAKSGWAAARDLSNGVRMKTRDIIKAVNDSFQEDISMGSYDDIRRKDLQMLVLGNIVVRTDPTAARNDSRRGYAINPSYTKLLRRIGAPSWKSDVTKFMEHSQTLKAALTKSRAIPTVPISLPSGKKLVFSPGEHNLLQKAIIEDFLPRYGFGAEILYVGDTANKFLHIEQTRLKELNFFELSHGELPDVVAYSPSKNWLYLIEAVYSSGPMSDARIMELKKLTAKCNADVVFVTAFLSRDAFRKFVKDVAWETEVWIADAPDHLIHFNGSKFLGPYAK